MPDLTGVVTVWVEDQYHIRFDGTKIPNPLVLPWSEHFTMLEAIGRAGGGNNPPYHVYYLVRDGVRREFRNGDREIQTLLLKPGDAIEVRMTRFINGKSVPVW